MFRTVWLAVMAMLDAIADEAAQVAADGLVAGAGSLDLLDAVSSPLGPRSLQQARAMRDQLFGDTGDIGDIGDIGVLGDEGPATQSLPQPTQPTQQALPRDGSPAPAAPTQPYIYPSAPESPRRGYYCPVDGDDGVESVLVVEGRLGAVNDVIWLRLIYAAPLGGESLN